MTGTRRVGLIFFCIVLLAWMIQGRAMGAQAEAIHSRKELAGQLRREVAAHCTRLQNRNAANQDYNRIHSAYSELRSKALHSAHPLTEQDRQRRMRAAAEQIRRLAYAEIRTRLERFDFRGAELFFTAAQRTITSPGVLATFQQETRQAVAGAYRDFLEWQQQAMARFFSTVDRMSWSLNWRGDFFPDYESYYRYALRACRRTGGCEAVEKAWQQWQASDQAYRREMNSRFRRANRASLEQEARETFGRPGSQVYPSFRLHFPARPPCLPELEDIDTTLERIFNQWGTWQGNEKTITCPFLHFRGSDHGTWLPDVYAGERADGRERHDISIRLSISPPCEPLDIDSELRFFCDVYRDGDDSVPRHPFPWGYVYDYRVGDEFMLLWSSEVDEDFMLGDAPRQAAAGSGRILLITFRDEAPVKVWLEMDISEPGLAGANFDTIQTVTRDIALALLHAFGGNTGQEAPAGTINLDLRPLTSSNLKTSPGKTSTCRLQVEVTDGRGRPVAGTSVVFADIQTGSLSARQVVTDAHGGAILVYTAPTEAELEALDRDEIKVRIKASIPESNISATDYVIVRRRQGRVAGRPAQPILPAGSSYYNDITFAFRGPKKPDAGAYRAVITLEQKASHGALVRSHGESGGSRRLEMKVQPKQKYHLSYHWLGPGIMRRPFAETVTIEIPELHARTTVTFSVGMDIAMQSAGLKEGDFYPGIFNALGIYVTDLFHPEADLLKLFEAFDLKLPLQITMVSHVPVPPDYKKEGFWSALVYAWTGSSSATHHDPFILADGMWGLRKRSDNRYLLRAQRESWERRYVQYPGIIVFERGGYQFRATIPRVGFDANPANNSVLTDVLEVKGYTSKWEEGFHTIVLPSIEFLLTLPSGGVSLVINGVDLGLTTKEFIDSVREGNWKRALFDLFKFYSATLDNLEIPNMTKEEKLKETLAGHIRTLVAVCWDQYGDFQNIKTGQTIHPGTGRAAAGRKGGARGPKRPAGNLMQVLDVARVAVKGCGKLYVALVEKKERTHYSIETPAHQVLRPTRPGRRGMDGSSPNLWDSPDFLVLAAGRNEQFVLRLKGEKPAGSVYLITPEKIIHTSVDPSTSGTDTFRISSSGVRTMASAGSAPKQGVVHIAGTWATSFGRLEIQQNGSLVTGRYSHDNGRLKGELHGQQFNGTWSEAPDYAPPRNSGTVQWTISADGNSFRGHWRYGHDGSGWDGVWAGHKLR